MASFLASIDSDIFSTDMIWIKKLSLSSWLADSARVRDLALLRGCLGLVKREGTAIRDKERIGERERERERERE